MKNLDLRKRVYLLLMSYLIILCAPKLKNNHKITYNPHYDITSDYCLATYDNKHIYITNDYELVPDNDNDIYILDDRCDDDPNFRIFDSYKVKDLKLMNSVINILLEYEKTYPSDWYRSFTSMKNEWLTHNICHAIKFETRRSSQVDLNNADEAGYANIINIIQEMFDNNSIKDKEEDIKTKIYKIEK